YRASVVPTPTMAMLLRADDGRLAGAAVLALEPGDQGGTVVLVPSATVVGDADARPGGEVTLADVYAREGAEATSQALGGVVTAAMGETLEVDSAVWQQLVDPVGPVELTLERPVGDWPAGEVSIAADEVGAFLSAQAEGEPDLARLERQQQFWNAWLPMVREAGDAAMPGEVETGVGRYVRTIAAGEGVAVELPVAGDGTPDGVVYQVDGGRLGAFVSGAIPFPTAPEPGTRTRVRLLNGTDDESLTTEAARELVAAGAEISVVGNADTLSEPETLFIHRGGRATDAATWLSTVIGGGRLEVVAPGQPGAGDDEIDVTVILGQDAGEIFGREQTSD
ncbi:MAG TPA: LCP family protein, partial [Acidimicrobiales bacterium]|nr:LCP family protein [Acidimicrobiales bacterium]